LAVEGEGRGTRAHESWLCRL